MPFSGYVMDSPHSKPFYEAIGKLLINFGAIELWTFSMYSAITEDKDYLKLIGKKFSTRCDMMLKEGKNKLSNKNRKVLETLIVDAKREAKFRNTIAHNPVVFHWKKGKLTSEAPDYIGLIDIETSAGTKIDKITYKQINEAINRVAKIAKAAHDFQIKVQSESEVVT